MIVRGSHDWKPADRRLSVQRHINWLDDNADIIIVDKGAGKSQASLSFLCA